MILTIKQTQALDILENAIVMALVFGGGAGGGKSALGCYRLLKCALKYPGTRRLMGRSKLKTLKETTLNTFFEIAKMQGVSHTFRYNSVSGILHFMNGSDILLKDLYYYPSDPNFDELGSLELTGAFIDETNQIKKKAWNIVMSRIRYKLDKYGLIPKILGTCNPAKNWVYTDFYDKDRVNNLDPGTAFVQSLVTDNPHISQHYIENLKKLPLPQRERLLYGNRDYDDDPATIFDFTNIRDMFHNTFVLGGEKYITADIATRGSDKFIVVIRSGLRIQKIYKIDKCDGQFVITFLKKKAKEYQVPYSNIIYDADGVGAGLGGRIEGATEFKNGSKPFNDENYQNLRSQCFFNLSRLVSNNEIYCADHNYKKEITEELSIIKQKDMDKDGKLKIIGKDEIKETLGRSPDYADAIMMRMLPEVEHKIDPLSQILI